MKGYYIQVEKKFRMDRITYLNERLMSLKTYYEFTILQEFMRDELFSFCSIDNDHIHIKRFMYIESEFSNKDKVQIEYSNGNVDESYIENLYKYIMVCDNSI